MLIPITINADDILEQYQISQKEVEDVIDYTVKQITAAFAVKWEETAKNSLSSTRDRYVQNLKVVDEGRMAGAVILDYSKDPLIKMIEEGASAFDMKEGFKNSSKKHIKKDGGWYLTIPFKIGTPDSQVTSGFANIMPQEVYNIVKKKDANPITNKSQGLSKTEVPTEFQAPKIRAAIVIPESTTFKEYQHKASIHQGIFKQKDSITGQVSYGSFRRVSDKSDESSWVFPGLDAKNLAEKAYSEFESNMQTVLEGAMDSALSYFGFE
jgi:hypothetical protein